MSALAPFVCRLPSRRILRVRGMDAHELLQGLFTNDLRELHPGGSMYGCFLYFTGRVLCDALLHQCRRIHDGQASILVDVDRSAADALFEHLSEMKMRKKVQLDNIGDELAVVTSLVPPSSAAGPSAASASLAERHTECFVDPRNDTLFPPATNAPPSTFSASSPPDVSSVASQDCPSGRWLLQRCITPITWAPSPTSTDPYTALLYRRGIGEGPSVFRDAKTLPFEGNLDFLQGVSFHKGCYLGQELTHRTHVMLVARKRTVPLLFSPANTSPLGAPSSSGSSDGVGHAAEVGEPLYSVSGEKIGEVTGVCGSVGIGLLRLRYVDPETHTVPGLQRRDGAPVQAHLPDWWPPKEVRKLLKKNG